MAASKQQGVTVGDRISTAFPTSSLRAASSTTFPFTHPPLCSALTRPACPILHILFILVASCCQAFRKQQNCIMPHFGFLSVKPFIPQCCYSHLKSYYRFDTPSPSRVKQATIVTSDFPIVYKRSGEGISHRDPMATKREYITFCLVFVLPQARMGKGEQHSQVVQPHLMKNPSEVLKSALFLLI